MLTCLIASALAVSIYSPIFAKSCNSTHASLDDTLKLVKYDAFFDGIEPKKSYNYLVKHTTVLPSCNLNTVETKRSLRFNWSNKKGFLKQVGDDISCLVFTFEEDSDGNLQITEELYSTLGGEGLRLGFFIDQSTQERVLYMGRISSAEDTYYSVLWPIKEAPKSKAFERIECVSKMLDSVLMPSSEGVQMRGNFILLCGFVGALAVLCAKLS